MVTLRNIAALMLLVLATSGVASEAEVDYSGAIINVDYSLAVPLGEARSYTSKGSPQGLGMELRFHGKHLKGGIGISWQVFREEKEAPGTLTGAKYENHTTSLLPILASGYYVWRHGGMRTFVGGGVGGMMAHLTLEAQAERTTDTIWYYGASGLAGSMFELTPGFGIEAKLRYIGGFKSSYKPIGMVQLSLGFIFLY